MKKAINVLTILVITLAFFLVISRYNIKIEAPGTFTRKVEKKNSRLFEDFPLDKQKFIDLQVDEDAFEKLTQREKRDQVLDWLLYTTLYSTGLPAETLNEILYDIPTIRYGYMHPVANFEFGSTRSCVIGDSIIIALIPRDIQENQYNDYLAGIADKHRTDLGEEPKIIHIFRYKIYLNERFALLKRCKDVKADALYTREYGYYTSIIKNLDDFKKFMGKIKDITFARVVSDNLKLGGRKLKEHYRGIRIEDVAAIWQAEKEIQDRLNRFEAKWQHNLDLLNKKLEEYNQRESQENILDNTNIKILLGENKKMMNLLERMQSTPNDVEGYQPPNSIISYKHYEDEYEKLNQMMQEDFIKARIPDNCGFSLDHTFNFKELQKGFSDPERISNSMLSIGLKLIKKEEIQNAADALRNNNIVPLLVIIDKLKKSDNEKAQSLALNLKIWTEYHRFQKARYDGPLKGTEVGMVLFYTDLLAKLWALDYMDSTPGKYIKDFNSLTQTKISPVFKQELIDLPSTRLWFGTNDKGFQEIGNSDRLLFARVAARVYAASSNPLQPGKEEAANAESSDFLGWWNDHYEEIARYEPEYQRLNEIMKWSILVTWLNNSNKGHYLDFLQDVKVYKGHWFPKWVKNQSNLKFKKWDQVEFYKPGYLGTKTEAMHILYSRAYERFGMQRALGGGVSLAPKNLFKVRKALPRNINKSIRRSHLNYGKTRLRGNARAINTLDGKSYNIKKLTSNRATVVGTPKPHAKLRGRHSELRHQGFERILSRKTTRFKADTKIGDNHLGTLDISRTKNGFKIGWKSRDIDAGQSIARKISKSENPVDVLIKDPRVESIIRKGKGDNFYIKMNQSETWLKMAPEKRAAARIDNRFQSRVSDVDNGLKNYQLKWLKETDLGSELRLGKSDYINIKSFKGTGKDVIVVSPTRGPPAFSKQFEINYGNYKIRGKVDPKTGDFFINRGSIPKNIRDKPGKLQNLVSKSDLQTIRKEAISSVEKITLKRTKLPNSDSFARSLRKKDYKNAAGEIAKDPQGLKTRLRENIKNELRRNKEFQDAGHYSKAIHHLDHLIEIHGPLPGLKIRKGITLLKRQRYTAAKDQFHQVMLNSSKNQRAQYFDEINSQLGNPSVRFKFKEPNQSYWEYFLLNTNSGQIAKETKIDRIIKSNAPIYIQDRPGLTNLDWPTAVKTKNLTQAIRGRRVVKLMNTGIEDFKPQFIYSHDTLVKNLPGKLSPGKQISKFKGLSYPYRFVRCYLPDEDENEGEVKHGYIYLIFAESV